VVAFAFFRRKKPTCDPALWAFAAELSFRIFAMRIGIKCTPENLRDARFAGLVSTGNCARTRKENAAILDRAELLATEKNIESLARLYSEAHA
jgi:hypothetical protein